MLQQSPNTTTTPSSSDFFSIFVPDLQLDSGLLLRPRPSNNRRRRARFMLPTIFNCRVKRENFKAMKEKQLELQHTMSRKGYARLTAELKAKRKVDSISRVVVWADGNRDKNGKPKNKNVAQKIEDMGKIERNGHNSTNLKEDAVSKVLGAERNGRVRTFGKGVTQTRLTIISQMNGQFTELREENAQMKSQMSDMRNTIDEFKKSQVQNPATTEATPTTPLVSPSVTCHPQSDITKCKLLDWMGMGDVVAEGRWASSDPHSCAHCVPIGPNAMKVWVDVAKKLLRVSVEGFK
ncbi:uncharacterized protein LOC131304339 [Rhododendron vialii]|uniref:uncharacterized protein LOC131304339 n=1 Tax=Rhododendron vialii TaxID=182163 RepID=UPI00265EF3FC|nr:uncharacterized protein LOC131304339 [Rhododendron vialii]